MLYIWCGTVLKHGMQDVICEIFDEIQKVICQSLMKITSQYLEKMER